MWVRKVSDYVRGMKKKSGNQWASHYAQSKSLEQQGTLSPIGTAEEAKTQTQCLLGFGHAVLACSGLVLAGCAAVDSSFL